MSDRTWGLDVSTSAKKTAAVALDWSRPGVATVVDVVCPLGAQRIAPLIVSNQDSTWAVDVPFGWPDQFVNLMADRHEQPLQPSQVPDGDHWNCWRTREVAQRLTDRFLTDDPRIKTRPLPASFQMLGATAAMWTLVEAELAAQGVTVDRAGLDGNVCETYPSAALAAWRPTQKTAPTTEKPKSKKSWSELQDLFPFFNADARFTTQLASDDVCDALVCALVARARDLNLTIKPENSQLAAARREGWIHVSVESPVQLTRARPGVE